MSEVLFWVVFLVVITCVLIVFAPDISYKVFVLKQELLRHKNEKTKTEVVEEDNGKDYNENSMECDDVSDNEIDYDRWKKLPLYQFKIEFDELKKEDKLSDEQRRRLNKIESEIEMEMNKEEVKEHYHKYLNHEYLNKNIIDIKNADSGWIRGLDIDELENMKAKDLKKELDYIFLRYILTEDQKQLLIDILYQKMKKEKLIENKDTEIKNRLKIHYDKKYEFKNSNNVKYLCVDAIENGKPRYIDIGRLENTEIHVLQEELNDIFKNYILTDGQKELLIDVLDRKMKEEKFIEIENVEEDDEKSIEVNTISDDEIDYNKLEKLSSEEFKNEECRLWKEYNLTDQQKIRLSKTLFKIYDREKKDLYNKDYIVVYHIDDNTEYKIDMVELKNMTSNDMCNYLNKIFKKYYLTPDQDKVLVDIYNKKLREETNAEIENVEEDGEKDHNENN